MMPGVVICAFAAKFKRIRLFQKLRKKRKKHSLRRNVFFAKIYNMKFGTIYIDPPWSYDNKSTRGAAEDHYGTLSVQELKDLPIARLLSDKAHIHLWTTNAFLPDSFGILKAWGVEYKGTAVWIKPQMGMGNYWRVSHEYLVLGVKGKLSFKDRGVRSYFMANRLGHSSKPETARALIERVSPGPYLEIFGRELVDGWTVIGDEIDKKDVRESLKGLY